MGISGPGADVDDVERLVDEIADRRQLGEDEGWSSGEIGQVKRVGGGGGGGRGARWWEGREPDVDVLRRGSVNGRSRLN